MMILKNGFCLRIRKMRKNDLFFVVYFLIGVGIDSICFGPVQQKGKQFSFPPFLMEEFAGFEWLFELDLKCLGRFDWGIGKRSLRQ